MSQISSSLANASPELLAALANTSAIPAPDGIIPDFRNPTTRSLTQISVTSVLLGIMLLFVANRIYVKAFLMRKATWDDGTILIALPGSITYYVACTWGAQRGRIGTHEWNISVLQAASSDLQIPSYLISVRTPLTMLFLKTSFFILYLQLFHQLQWLRICSWFGMVGTAIIYTVMTISVFVWATPHPGETRMAHQVSRDQKRMMSLSVLQSIIALIIDLYILALPVIGVSRLQLSPKRKVGALLIFLSGLVACVCSACSIYFRVILDRVADVTWALIPVNISTMCELFVGVICACMPAAAYAARHSNSPYQRLAKSVSSRFDRLKSTYLGFKNSVQTHTSQSQFSQSPTAANILQSTDRKYAAYFSLNDSSTNASQVDHQNNNPSTVSHSKSTNQDKEGILQTFDVDVERN